MGRPQIPVVTGTRGHSAVIDRIVAAGWGVEPVRADDPTALIMTAEPAIVLIDLHDDNAAVAALVRAIRGRDDALADVPLVAAGATASLPDGVDQMLDPDASPEDVRGLLAFWSADANAALDRLAETFGHDDIVALVAAFRGQLAAAHAALRSADDRSGAHQIAGMAGTLGYTALGTAWNALDHGETAAAPVLRLTRKAIYDMSRRLGNAATQRD